VKRFKFRIASGAVLLVVGLLFAVGHGAAGLAILALVLIAIGVVAFKVL
jgi:multisubunit Na+/H+ antiporter MnhB subunit